MNQKDTDEAMDQDLWQRYEKLRQIDEEPGAGDIAGPDALLLAGYLDGALSETEQAEVEAWLVANPDALDAVINASASLQDPGAPAPQSLVARASALVDNQPENSQPSSLRAWLNQVFAAPTRALSIATVVGFLAVSGGAFELGQAAYAETAALSQALTSESDWVIEPFELQML